MVVASAPSRQSVPRIERLVTLGVALVLTVLSAGQSPGLTTFDTKFDLSVDPAGFLSSALRLWNPELSFGELQNQAYGYLFPQGPFFLLGDVLGAPAWVVQRAWSALILLAAFDGARRLARGLAPDHPWWWQVLAGAAYALSARMVGLAGILSAEALPGAVLPYVAVPVVLAIRGRWSLRRAAAASAAAFLFTGGVNASAALAILPLPILLIAFAGRDFPRRAFALRWGAAIGVVSLWWLVPLVLLGRFSPPFLDVIETSAAATGPLGWANVVRGLDHWLFGVLSGAQPWWFGPYALATAPALVAATAVVGGVGLLGLTDRTMPARGPLLAAAGVAALLLVAGHDSAYGGLLSSPVQALLDGPLAPLRNVHKVDPVLRLPLALGLAHAATRAVAKVPRRRTPQATGGWLAVGSLGLVVLIGAGPLLTGTARQPGWSDVPAPWRDAAAWLGQQGDAGRAWIVPGSGFGQQTWGWTIDEPIQPLATGPWVTRSQVPLVPFATMRHLDALEAQVASGRGSDVLSDALARSGVGFVLVRDDLEHPATQGATPRRVEAALADSPGLTRVRVFSDGAVHLTVYRVDRKVTTTARTVPSAEAVRVIGGPENVLDALRAGVVGARTPVLLEGPSGAAATILTDGPQRRERHFGRMTDAVSQLLTATEAYRYDRKVHDFLTTSTAAPVVAATLDGTSVSASSSGADATTLGPVRPEFSAWAAVDGSPQTAWRSSGFAAPAGQWLQVSLPAARPVPYVDVVAGVDGFTSVPIRRVSITTDTQTVERDVDPGSGFARIDLSGAATRGIRVTVVGVAGPSIGSVALRELAIPGVTLSRFAWIRAGTAQTGDALVLRTNPGRRTCAVAADETVFCEPFAARGAEEAVALRRVVRTAAQPSWHPWATVVAAPGPSTATLLDPAPGQGAIVRALSVLGDDPLVAAAFAHDGDPTTFWASAAAPAATLSVEWPKARQVFGVRVVRPTGFASRELSRVRVVTDGETFDRTLDGDGSIVIPATTTRQVSLTFLGGPSDSNQGIPWAIAELTVFGAEDTATAIDQDSWVPSTCGSGPALVIDGTATRTFVHGTIGDVLRGRELTVLPCDPVPPVDAGQHLVELYATDHFLPSSVTFAATVTAPLVQDRATTTMVWERTHREVSVASGPEGVLIVPENVNRGWQATLDGDPLVATTVDGWQQGYLIPAGAGGVVTLTFTPDTPYRLALAAGGGAALALVVGAGLLWWWERRLAPPLPGATAGWREGTVAVSPGRALVAVSVMGLVGGCALAAGIALALPLARDGRLAARRLGALAILVGGLGAVFAAVLGRPVSPGPADLAVGFAAGLLSATAVWVWPSRVGGGSAA